MTEEIRVITIDRLQDAKQTENVIGMYIQENRFSHKMITICWLWCFLKIL